MNKFEPDEYKLQEFVKKYFIMGISTNRSFYYLVSKQDAINIMTYYFDNSLSKNNFSTKVNNLEVDKNNIVKIIPIFNKDWLK